MGQEARALVNTGNRTYRPDGLLLGQRFGNGINEVRQYDTQGRLNYQSLASADTRLEAIKERSRGQSC